MTIYIPVPVKKDKPPIGEWHFVIDHKGGKWLGLYENEQYCILTPQGVFEIPEIKITTWLQPFQLPTEEEIKAEALKKWFVPDAIMFRKGANYILNLLNHKEK